jgi:hypothetical protein
VLAEAAAGRLRPVIGQVFPLERAADAHATLAARSAIGKTLLLVLLNRWILSGMSPLRFGTII